MNTDKNVLIVYTGGTIGMIKDAMTGILLPFNFSQLQQQIPELNQLAIKLNAVSFEDPIDSSNIQPHHWTQIALIIEEHYDAYDGFVVLHGTDTMSFTASALSFMLKNLAKPIILTGSQLPIGMVRTDGKENIITAIEIAADYDGEEARVPEVAVYFENELYRGNRTYKYNAEHFDAFHSPNYPPLAEAGVHIKYNSQYIQKANGLAFGIDTRMNNKVAVLTLFPGVSQHIVRAALDVTENKLLILRTFGSGNAMTDDWFLSAIEEAIQNGLLVINVSQCVGGGVLQGRYETSAGLSQMGVISAGDMLIEAAITKSMHLLGQGLTGADFAHSFSHNLMGEMTV